MLIEIVLPHGLKMKKKFTRFKVKGDHGPGALPLTTWEIVVLLPFFDKAF